MSGEATREGWWRGGRKEELSGLRFRARPWRSRPRRHSVARRLRGRGTRSLHGRFAALGCEPTAKVPRYAPDLRATNDVGAMSARAQAGAAAFLPPGACPSAASRAEGRPS